MYRNWTSRSTAISRAGESRRVRESGEGVEQRACGGGLTDIAAQKIHRIEERDETGGEQQRLRAAGVERQAGSVISAGHAETAGEDVIERRSERSCRCALQAADPLRKERLLERVDQLCA